MTCIACLRHPTVKVHSNLMQTSECTFTVCLLSIVTICTMAVTDIVVAPLGALLTKSTESM